MKTTFQPVESKNPRNENVREIQSKTLMMINVVLAGIAYIWLVFIVWPWMGRVSPPAAWIGCMILVLGTFFSYIMRTRNVALAYWIMVGSVYASILFAFIAYQLPGMIFLFILPILISSVFYHPRNIVIIVLVMVMTVVHLNLIYFGNPFFSLETLSQAGLMVFAGMASWLSARNLYEALEWVRAGYDQAYRNEQMVRQQQVELLRTLKALDNSSYQMERLNHFLMIERDRAEEAWQLKRRFAQNISHELRTPLSLIVGFSELMIHSSEYYNGALPPQYLRDMTTIYRNARHLQSMTNDVLELAGIDAAQVSLVLEKVDPAELAQDAANTIRSLVENRGLSLSLEIQPDLPQVWLDPTRIRQVLFNLLNNAARFTDKGEITIRVKADEREVCYSVKDTGVGIPPEAQSRIFEEFEQVRRTGENRGGTGLGLAISQRFVQLHGGRIWVESEPNKGSVFSFALPISGRDYTQLYKSLADRQHQAREVERVGKTSLVVAITGNTAVAGFLSRRISGGRVISLQNVETAPAALEKILPQAVIVDTSWEPAKPIDWDEVIKMAGLDIPIVYCGLSAETQIQKQLPVEAYLIKPVEQREILDTVRRIGTDVQNILIVDDDRDFVQFITRVLHNPSLLKYHIFTAHNGMEALDMFRVCHPDLVFMDLMMPEISGEEVIRQMIAVQEEQKNEQSFDHPLDSSEPWEEDLEDWYEAGEEDLDEPQHKQATGDEKRSPGHSARFVIVSGNLETEGMNTVAGPVVIQRQGGLLPGLVIRLLNELIGDNVTDIVGENEGESRHLPVLSSELPVSGEE